MSKELVICATPHETRVAIVEDGQLCEIYVEREKEFALVGSIYKGRVNRVLPGMQSAFVDIGLDSDAFLYVSDFLEDLEEYDHVVSTAEGKVQRMEQEGGRVFAPATNGGAEAAPAIEPAEVATPAQESAAVMSEAVPATVAEPGSGPVPAAPPAPRSEDLPGEVRTASTGDAPPPPMSDSRRDFRGGRGGFGRDRGGRGDRGDRGGRGRFGRGGGRPDRGGDRRPGRDFPASKYASHRPYEPAPATDEAAGPISGEPIILAGESLAKYRDKGPGSQPAEGHSAQPAEANLRVSPSPAAEFDELHAEAQVVHPLEQETSPAVMERKEPVGEQTFRAVQEETPAELRVMAALPEVRHEEVVTPLAAPAVQGHHAAAAGEPDLTEEQVINLAAQMAEVEQEEAEAARHEEMEAAAEEAHAAAEMEEGAEPGAGETEEIEEEEGAAAAGAYEVDETDQEIRQGILDAANGTPQEEIHTQPAENHRNEQPSSARVGGDQRPRFQRPMRRGGSRRPGRGPQRGGRPQHSRGHQAPRRPQLISEMLKAGEEIIVQIAKEPLGRKGARITSHVALPGRYLVYMPTVEHIGVSRKINSADKRSRLRHLVAEAKTKYPGGFIVRTAAESASDEEIRTDIDFLGKTWQETVARSEQRKAPAILHRDLNLVERILRDHVSNDYTSIWIDNEEEYTKVVEFVGRFQPALVSRVKLYTKETPIFEELGIQQEIDKSLRPKVWLKSGGYIVINHTEALVAIDVNTGKFVGKGSTRLEDTIVHTNIEAVKEVVRQIRLRDLGGIIVVDFIDMEERRNREKVMYALEDALRSDRAPSKVLPFNEFGLVAITRKRTKQALERVLCQPCPYCTGSGMVKSLPTICYEIQAEARKMASELEGASVTLRVHPEIAKALKTRESALIEELEKWTRKSVIIQGDPTLHWEQYDIY